MNEPLEQGVAGAPPPSPTPRGDALAGLLFPAAEITPPERYEEIYPPRSLPRGAMVTRFAPSPTGFMHIGGIFVSLINKRVAAQTGGVFYLRIEDTDTKRTIPGALDTILDSLDTYGLAPDEGMLRSEAREIVERGAYGPYIQSKRARIYRDFAAWLIRRDLAYPCFSSTEEIAATRVKQTATQVKPGVHGRWAEWRHASVERVQEKLREGVPYVVRLVAPESSSDRIEWKDAVKGVISMPVNDVDSVLLKSDGIPTYHFAHAVDDHLMRTTHVIRGDEWLSSTPLHLQLVCVLGFPPVAYAHVPPIQKLERTEEVDPKTGAVRTVDSRRKLSKRTDPEANIEFCRELGVPEAATVDYLLNIANSAFEEWRSENPAAPYTDFGLKLDRLAPGGALSDVVKLKSISKEVIARMDASYEVELASTGERARLLLGRGSDPDLVVLDLGLPDMSGLDVLAYAESRTKVPIVVLTAETSLAQRLECFRKGAVDFVAKPFWMEELIARVRVRLGAPATSARQTVGWANAVIDLDARTVTVDGAEVPFPRTEFNVLAYLVRRGQRAVTRAQLAEHCLANERDPDERTVDTYVARIRKKLGEAAGEHVATVWGVGYRFVDSRETGRGRAAGRGLSA